MKHSENVVSEASRFCGHHRNVDVVVEFCSSDCPNAILVHSLLQELCMDIRGSEFEFQQKDFYPTLRAHTQTHRCPAPPNVRRIILAIEMGSSESRFVLPHASRHTSIGPRAQRDIDAFQIEKIRTKIVCIVYECLSFGVTSGYKYIF